jgi:hypothetical protein
VVNQSVVNNNIGSFVSFLFVKAPHSGAVIVNDVQTFVGNNELPLLVGAVVPEVRVEFKSYALASLIESNTCRLDTLVKFRTTQCPKLPKDSVKFFHFTVDL